MGENFRDGPPADLQLELLRSLTSRLLNAVEVSDVLHVITECTTTVLGYKDCVVYLRGPGDILVQRAAIGNKSDNCGHVVDPVTLAFGEGIVGAAAQEATALIVCDTREDPRYIVDDADRRSELAVPIIDDGEVIGVIDSEHPEPGFYTEADRDIIIDIATVASVRLRSAMAAEDLSRSIANLESVQAQLEILSMTDELTQLGNRRRFEEDLAAAMATGQVLSVCILDLDKFKQVNDTHGHHEGDQVLRNLARILEDTADGENITIARLGGDEFAILQVGGDVRHFDRMIENIVEAVQSTVWSANAALLDVSVSAGVATGHDEETWTLADEALLLAKAEGSNQMLRFEATDPRTIAMRAERTWAQSIRDAISSDRLSLVAQPIVPSGAAAGPPIYEVLLRYHATDGSILAPGVSLDNAVRFGLVDQIDMWVLRTAIAWLGTVDEVVLSVNVSPSSVLSGLAIREAIAELQTHNVAPSRLIIEVTESAAIEDADRFKAALADARAAGIRMAMDDFGSGWTSLAVIKENPVDIIKIDGTWVRDATTDKVAHTVVQSIIECSHLLGSTVVAEWVEDQATLELLRTMGAEYVQGFFLSPPVPLSELSTPAP